MNATVKNLDDLGRYMMNMYRATDLFTQVTIKQRVGRWTGTDWSRRLRWDACRDARRAYVYPRDAQWPWQYGRYWSHFSRRGTDSRSAGLDNI